jgi:hypothetical protein
VGRSETFFEGSHMKKEMILKVQIPIFSNIQDRPPKALIYNEDRSFETFLAIQAPLKRMMKGEHKVYCKAEVLESIQPNGEPMIRFKEIVGDPGW